jgi:membrane-associated phospholipid phosphatase
MHSFFSFPSGHSAGAFSLFFMISLILSGKRKFLGVFLFLLAMLTGYSRIYLGQHFPVDVYAGSIIGVGFTWLTYWAVNRSELAKKPWANKSLIIRSKTLT